MAFALVVVISAVFVGGFFLMRQGIESQNRQLLEADAAHAAQLVSSSYDGLSGSLVSLGTVAALSGAQPSVFEDHARPLANSGTSVALARDVGHGFVVVGSVGQGFASGRPVTGPLATDLGRAGGQLRAAVVSRQGGVEALAFFVGPPLTPAGTAVVLQDDYGIVPTERATSAGPFKNLEVALYASKVPVASQLVLSTPAVPSGGDSVSVTVPVGADRWLLVASAKTPLVGAFATAAPWILLGVGLMMAVLAGGVVQSLARRERFAADLVARRTAELERRTTEVTLISEMTDVLQSCRTVAEAGEFLGQLGGEVFPSTNGALYVFAASRNQLSLHAGWGTRRAESDPLVAPDDCWALRRGRLQSHGLRDDAPRCRHAAPEASEYLCVPMLALGETVGLLHLWTGEQPGSPRFGRLSGRTHLASTAAEHLALAIANLQLREKLRDQSIRDPLTGLFNRRYLEEALPAHLHRAARQRTPVAVLMADVDHFKRFNDSFGHESGDLALREIAACISDNVRGEDLACRYGGEEFVLVLAGASAEEARARAEELGESVRSLRALSDNGVVGQALTISIGIAVYPDDGATGRDLVRVADVALYRAKSEGRDRVVCSGEGRSDRGRERVLR